MDSLNIVFYGILNIAPSEYRPVELVVAYHRLIVSTGTVGELRDLLKERFEQTTQVRVTHWQRLQAYATEMKKVPVYRKYSVSRLPIGKQKRTKTLKHDPNSGMWG